MQNRYYTERHFPLLQSVQAGSGTNTNFHRVGTAGSILRKKAVMGHQDDRTHLVPRLRMSEAILSHVRFRGVGMDSSFIRTIGGLF